MTTSMVKVAEGIELCAETYGDPADPAVLLMHGATSPMDWWEPDFCSALALAGRYVIRYDHRDTGASTTWPVGEPGYSGEELTLDPLCLLDALQVDAAHLVGVSMGGGIAQDLAVRFPRRVLSLTLIATMCAFERRDSTALPPPDPRLQEAEQDGELDWDDDEVVIAEMARVQGIYAGSLFDQEQALRTARRVVERSVDVQAATVNHWQVIGSGEDDGPARTMADIAAPTLVIHGTEDPMFPHPHGQALADEIAGATLLKVDGMGHEAPPRPTWETVIPAIVEHTQRKDR